MKIDLSKLAQLFTIIVGLLTINQWVSSSQSWINRYTNPINDNLFDLIIGLNTYFNNTQANLAMHITAYFNNTNADLTQVTYPTLSVSNIYLSDKGFLIALLVILIMMLIGLIEFESFSKILLFGIAFGILFNLIYFVSSYYLSPTWLLIATVIAMIVGHYFVVELLKEDETNGGKKDGKIGDEEEYIRLEKVANEKTGNIRYRSVLAANKGDEKKGADEKRFVDIKKGTCFWLVLCSFIVLIPLMVLELILKAALSILTFILSIITCFL